MKIVAMIPARYGATRFPGKLMKQLGGKEIILRTWEVTKNTGLFDEVYVVTDSEVIFDLITSNGGQAIMSQKEHETGSDRIAEAVENMDVDIIVNVQGDEPFTKKKPLEQVLQAFHGPDADKVDLASLMQEMRDEERIEDWNYVKVVCDKDDFAMYFSRSPIPYRRNKKSAAKVFNHIGIYAFRKAALMDFYKLPMRDNEDAEQIEAIRYLEYGKKIKMVETDYMGVKIDTPEDFEAAKAYMISEGLE